MNKWAIASFLFLLLAFVYLLLPEEIAISERSTMKVNSGSAYRYLSDESRWAKWWPGNTVDTAKSSPLVFERFAYSLQQNYFNTLVIQINGDYSNVSSSLLFIPLGVDYTIFDWKAIVQGNFFQKIQTYLRAKRIQSNMEDILQSLKIFMEKEENIYGIKVRQTNIRDTALVATSFITPAYPSTNQIYQYISVLKAYIQSQNATVTNHPMLHVKQLDSHRFESMVAVPTSVALKGTGKIAQKRMVPGSNILEAEVRGGALTAQEAMVQLGNYVQDHQLASPAIPFLSLVTDRTNEKDTARWVTKVYYPIF